MATVLLTGATGVFGQEIRPHLSRVGHDVRAVSRSPPPHENTSKVEWIELDLSEGVDLEGAVDGIDIIVHAASDARGDSAAVDVRGTEKLLRAAADGNVANFLYVSIVGIEEITYTYYEQKLEAERIIQSSPVPSTIVRSTQFYPFIAYLLSKVSKLPVWPLPTKFRLQPIDPGEVAEIIVDFVTEEAAGRIPAIGGPEVLSVRELAKEYRESLDLFRPVLPCPIPGSIPSAFRAGAATCPDRDVGTITWDEWLASKEGVPGQSAY